MADAATIAKRRQLRDVNLMGLEYYERFYQETYKEWQKFISGNREVDCSVIPEEVYESWVRCAELGLEPLARPQNKVLEGDELNDLLTRNKELIDVAYPFMKNLYRFLEGSGFLLSLLDREVHVLAFLGDAEEEKLIRTARGFVGACWAEKYSGNNVAACVAFYKKPMQVFGPQQYVRLYHGATGCGAPIFDADGEFIGIVTIFGRYYRANPHTLGIVASAASAIQNELKIRRALMEAQMAASYQQTVISSIQEALIVLDSYGHVTLINEIARGKLDLDNTKVQGRRLRDILPPENAPFFALVENNETITDTEVRILSNKSSGDYTLTCSPVLSPGGGTTGTIIILNEIRRAKSMVTKMMGATANFSFDDIYGRNHRFLTTIDQARMVSQSSSNVLLLGKSGTGKDIFAQAIHNASSRKNGPYVAINCGAIPRDLIASELFGHEEGAFTGSRRGGNQGKFELADGGTLFLDEIAETPLELQTALLRVIEDKSVLRIGGTRVRPVDVRIIAATNKDLRAEVRKGNFREDLYYRANVFAIEMIELKERIDDIPILADYFIKRYASAMKKRITRVDKRVIDAFMSYSWPGNVRELQNAIERMINFLKTSELTYELVPEYMRRPSYGSEYHEESAAPEEEERQMIARLLHQKMRKNRIAEKMNISRATLYRKMKLYGLG